MSTPTTEVIDTQALLARIAELEQRVAALEQSPAQGIEDRLAMVVFSGDLDKAIAAFIIATGAASMGLEVSMFFTFWGISAVKKQKVFSGKNILEQGFTAMLPGKLGELGLSQMNFFGVGAQIIRNLMKKHDVASPEELFAMARELGVRMVVCDMSRELLGIKDEELVDGLETGGVATFLGDAARAKVTLFI
ncbi:MAG: DsrE/DsrF/DrsH-like family protein [Chloroflexus sp.]|jgi:peroxiredoxin family protein|uniref:DsrE/DsrF/DrsH-like family protein n=1 Tax=Chloroflexus sp. MS-G TaxID=1521187 RepID=UPI0004DFCC47|nr:DsrE/DsrF/DrsH-like family protein [Chloroflexus sp. MS-G]MBO9315857.1 DsrE/DsrF/DrsH-like family protein [Chloroflexus sp.]MBO9348877.1 DsrE/DsrF/DrsH-like family protein [Chloroflexus sp.]